MDRMVKVVYKDNVIKEFPVGTSLATIKKSFQRYYNYQCLFGIVLLYSLIFRINLSKKKPAQNEPVLNNKSKN